jgi:hypothetical protein
MGYPRLHSGSWLCGSVNVFYELQLFRFFAVLTVFTVLLQNWQDGRMDLNGQLWFRSFHNTRMFDNDALFKKMIVPKLNNQTFHRKNGSLCKWEVSMIAELKSRGPWGIRIKIFHLRKRPQLLKVFWITKQTHNIQPNIEHRRKASTLKQTSKSRRT